MAEFNMLRESYDSVERENAELKQIVFKETVEVGVNTDMNHGQFHKAGIIDGMLANGLLFRLKKTRTKALHMLFAAKMLHNLLLDLLDLGQIENQTFRIENRYFDLLSVITQAFTVLHYPAKKKGVRLETEVNCDTLFLKHVYGDERRYLQILISFLSHAVNMSPDDATIVVNLKIDQLAAKTEVTTDSGDSEDGQESQMIYVSFDITINDFHQGLTSAESLFANFDKMKMSATQ
jgi:signal transduction histidine kinase